MAPKEKAPERALLKRLRCLTFEAAGDFHVKLRVCAVLAVLLSASPALAFPGVTDDPCDPTQQPPLSAQQPVTEPFEIYVAPAEEMNATCNTRPGPIMFGCTYQATADRGAMVVLNGALSPAERACVLIYEKAHLPPNNWDDAPAEALLKNFSSN